MTSIAHPSVSIQTSSRSVPVPPPWLGEVALLVHHLRKQGVLDTISAHVRVARRRFGRFEVLDFVAVLFGYALSGERTLEAFYERLRPWATAFMALFERDRLPSRSALSRWLAALTSEPVEALRACFLADLLARKLSNEEQRSGLWDRAGNQWLVFDVDGTREAARQRALPQTPDRPGAQRRLRPLCAPGYLGRKRGEIVRTRTTVLQAHTSQWLGTFGNAGNGDYRAELRQAVGAIHSYLTHQQVPSERAVVRLDGQYGTAAVLVDLAGLAYVTRGQDYHLLERDEVQTRLHLPPDQQITHPESGVARLLYDCPAVSISGHSPPCRIIVATHPALEKKSRVGSTRAGVVYELFLTALPQDGFTAADVVALYLHRGAFEPVLSDEDQEQDPDRWCSHAACGQECWQIVSQWVWNLRLELGHHLKSEPVRTTEFAPALTTPPAEATPSPTPAQGYGPAAPGQSWKQGRFSGRDFVRQPDGTLRCPAGQTLIPHERRREADGSLRVDYASQHPQLSPLRVARAVPMAGPSHCQTPPGERAVASPRGGLGSRPLARLEPTERAAGVSGVGARPTSGGPGGAWPRSQPTCPGSAPVSSSTGTLAAVLARAIGAQRPCPHGWPGDDPPVRRSRCLRPLSRPGDRLRRRRPRCSRFSDSSAAPGGAARPLFLVGPFLGSRFASFAPSSAGFATTPPRGIPFCAGFAHQISSYPFDMLVAHRVGYAVRVLMHEAALQADRDPNRLSFVHALEVVRDAVPEFQLVVPEQHPLLYARLLVDLAAKPLPERCLRLNTRVVKRKMSNFKQKRPEHRRPPKLQSSFRPLWPAWMFYNVQRSE